MTLIDTIKRLLGQRSDDISAQATIDASRRRTRTFVRDAAVELDTAPVDVPADAQPPAVDRPEDGAARDARRDRFQE